MFRFKTPHLVLLFGLIAPVCSYAASYCIKVNGGFGNGGTTFIAPNFTVPAAGTCQPWSGFTKTATTAILFTSGAGCTSTNGVILTLSVSGQDPSFISPGTLASDWIQLCAAGFNRCSLGGEQIDQGEFSGPAAQVTCTAGLLKLPPSHD